MSLLALCASCNNFGTVDLYKDCLASESPETLIKKDLGGEEIKGDANIT